MALTTELMSATEIIAKAIPNADFDVALLDKRILKAQRRYVRDLISEDFYEELQTQIAGGSLTPDNTTLLDDYIKPMLSYYVIYEALPEIRNNITSSGVMENAHEFAQQSSRFDYASLRNQMLADAEDWRGELIHFIKEEKKDDSSKYPLYNNNDTNTFNKYGIIPY